MKIFLWLILHPYICYETWEHFISCQETDETETKMFNTVWHSIIFSWGVIKKTPDLSLGKKQEITGKFSRQIVVEGWLVISESVQRFRWKTTKNKWLVFDLHCWDFSESMKKKYLQLTNIPRVDPNDVNRD